MGVFGGFGGLVFSPGCAREVSPERAEEIYYEAYGVGLVEFAERREPVVQRELRLKCWAAVVDAVERDFAARMAQTYLRGTGDAEG